MSLRSAVGLVVLGVALGTGGCDDAPPTTKPKPPAAAAEGEGKKVKVGDNVHLEVSPKARRVLVEAVVCLREGALEQLLTRKNQKEHEAILAADVDARKVHEALLLAKAEAGSPVRWVPKYRPPTGSTIKVSLVYTDAKGKKVTVPARSWIKNRSTGKELEHDWVFAGSLLIDNPQDKNAAKYYLANDGDVICVANFEGAMLDLPIQSSKDDADRAYDAWTERIPPVGTKVTVVLEPVEGKRK
ncbi:MAG: YdjY domain-containing protein [Gemmataceae bacterium]